MKHEKIDNTGAPAGLRVALTGATGFVGSHVAQRLMRQGCEVTCLVRPTSDLRWIASMPVRTLRLDFEAGTDSVEQALEDQDVVVHLAGAVKAKRPPDFFSVNVGLTKQILQAALAARSVNGQAAVQSRRGPKRFVFLSSLAAAGPTGPRAQRMGLVKKPVSAYGQSKKEAEEALLRFREEIEVVILRPTAVYGPRDLAMLDAFRAAALGLVVEPAGARQQVSFCHVEDLAQMVAAATMQSVPSGSVIPVASTGRISMRDFSKTLLRAVDRALDQTGQSNQTRRRWPRLHLTVPLPPAVLRLAGLAAGRMARIVGRAPMLDADKARELTAGDWVVDEKAAQRLLGVTPQWSLDAGLEQTARWYHRERWL